MAWLLVSSVRKVWNASSTAKADQKINRSLWPSLILLWVGIGFPR
jgi:hypothetical protein